jgi:uncharacterized protein (DUF58 family)
MNRDLDRAELAQALKAFLIPASLFLATLISAAGAFLIYSGYSLGLAFLFASAAIMTGAFVAFFRFQNKLRAAGHFKPEESDRASNHEGNSVAPETPSQDRQAKAAAGSR